MTALFIRAANMVRVMAVHGSAYVIQIGVEFYAIKVQYKIIHIQFDLNVFIQLQFDILCRV